MNEKTLLKISLIFSILGILLILFISENTSIDLSNISEITKENIDEKVRIQGIVTNIVETESLTILNVKDNTGKITIIIFEIGIGLQKDQRVEIIGSVTDYEDQLEIMADQIKKI
jgi:RecJ-like exonuclease